MPGHINQPIAFDVCRAGNAINFQFYCLTDGELNPGIICRVVRAMPLLYIIKNFTYEEV